MLDNVLSESESHKDFYTILLIEDSEVQRLSIRYILEKDSSASYEIIETSSGEEGLLLYRDNAIDCVILDYVLPDIDGLDFMRLVRSEDGFIERPIVFVTAEGDRAIVAKAMEYGATEYIEKHRYEKDMLVRTVQRAIEKKRYEILRRESDEFLRSMLDIIPLPVFYKTADLRYASCNKAFAQFFGLPKKNIVGKTVCDIAPERYAQDYELRDREILETLEPQRYEMPVLSLKGDLREMVFNQTIYKDTRGRAKGIIGVLTDITELKKARDELLKAKVEAEFANQSKTQFIASTSHEIRTPLNGVIGMLQLLNATLTTPEQREYLDVAMSAAESLLEVVDDVIDVTRIESGKIEIERTDFNLDTLLRTVMAGFTGNEKLKYIDMHYEIGEGTPEIIHMDEGVLRQILTNLVGNAVKYTRRGSIHVHVHPLLDNPERKQLLFSVADTGPGITDEALEYIFQPYYQERAKQESEQQYRKVLKGSGLGLAIVTRLVSMLGGTISVDTEADVGTTMYFGLPVSVPRPAKEPVAEAALEPSPEPMKSLHILVAEDNPVNQLVLCRTLEKLGHKTTVAADGYEALDLMRDKVFDLVLMDIQMPEMNGVEATRRIRKGEEGRWNPSIPIIAVTAHAMKGDRERLLEQGMNEYLPKPVDIDNLNQVIQRVCRKE